MSHLVHEDVAVVGVVVAVAADFLVPCLRRLDLLEVLTEAPHQRQRLQAGFGLVRKEPEKNGHTKYYPANSYIALWYKTLLTASPNADGSFGEDVYDRFMRYFNDEILSAFYKEMCAYWLERNINSISTDCIDTKDLSYRNVKVGSVTFDFACEKKRAVYAYYDSTLGGKLTQKLWKEIESSTTKDRPFYENEYVICTVNRVPDSFWTLIKHYDNVHIVPLKSLFATFNRDYNRRVHPRFVPSFV